MSESTHSRIADEALAAELAQAAGAILLGIRAEGLGVDDGRELGRRGDKAADSYILDRLAAERPGDAVLSEGICRRSQSSGCSSGLDHRSAGRLQGIRLAESCGLGSARGALGARPRNYRSRGCSAGARSGVLQWRRGSFGCRQLAAPRSSQRIATTRIHRSGGSRTRRRRGAHGIGRRQGDGGGARRGRRVPARRWAVGMGFGCTGRRRTGGGTALQPHRRFAAALQRISSVPAGSRDLPTGVVGVDPGRNCQALHGVCGQRTRRHGA